MTRMSKHSRTGSLRRYGGAVIVLTLVAGIWTTRMGSAASQTASTISNADWTRPFPAFRLIGNVYWVGTYDLATYLITSRDGHILINTGMKDTVPEIAAGVAALGFRMADVKILTATHGHWDHVAGMAELQRLTKASMVMSEADADLMESGGRTDFRWGQDPGSHFEPVKVARRLKDGDRITLGEVALTAHHHPGHTKGATSFTLDVTDDGRTFRVGIMNMASINPGVTLVGMPGYPTIADDYARTFAAQRALSLDVFLASHASQFRMHQKYKPGDTYSPTRFVDPDGYRSGVANLERAYQAQLARDRAK
jgi:metallo-beta-lactamase class B